MISGYGKAAQVASKKRSYCHHGGQAITSDASSSQAMSSECLPTGGGCAHNQPLRRFSDDPRILVTKSPEADPRSDPELLNINIGGTSFKLRKSSILTHPDSRLGRLCRTDDAKERLQLSDGFLTDSEEYYFERSPVLFEHLILAYRNSEVHMPETLCPSAFLAELEFWGLPANLIKPCCSDNVQPYLHLEAINTDDHVTSSSNYHTALNSCPSTVNTTRTLPSSRKDHFASSEKFDDIEQQEAEEPDKPPPGRCGLTRSAIWQFLEVPSSSIPAMAFMVISCVFILATVVVLLLGSLKDFQVQDKTMNVTEAIPELEVVDAVCVVWFSIEYVARLWAAPERLAYVKSALSVIDLLACAPFYLEQMFNIFGVHSKSFADFRRSLVPIRVLRVMRVLRVLRVLKVARYSKGFQSMGQTLLRSWRELVLLTLFMLTTNIMFSTAMYFLEADVEGTKFYSIPEAAWWCVITMTTVGYGDVYPITAAGKVLAGLVSISGIILLAFPISVIVENFNQEYHPKGESDEEVEETGNPGHQTSMKLIDGKVYVEVSSPKPKKRKAHVKAF